MHALLSVACLLLTGNGAAAPQPVPNMIGQRTSDAVQAGALAGFTVVAGDFYIARDKWRPDIVPETIYLQTPRAGALAPEGAIVAGWRFLRAAPEQPIATMPDLRGKAWSAARDLAQQSKLPVMTTAPADDAALVIDQYPRAGQSIIVGTAVHLMVDLSAPQ